jgi:hypothetical protein
LQGRNIEPATLYFGHICYSYQKKVLSCQLSVSMFTARLRKATTLPHIRRRVSEDADLATRKGAVLEMSPPRNPARNNYGENKRKSVIFNTVGEMGRRGRERGKGIVVKMRRKTGSGDKKHAFILTRFLCELQTLKLYTSKDNYPLRDGFSLFLDRYLKIGPS